MTSDPVQCLRDTYAGLFEAHKRLVRVRSSKAYTRPGMAKRLTLALRRVRAAQNRVSEQLSRVGA